MTSLESIKNKVYPAKMESYQNSDYYEETLEELRNNPDFAGWSEEQLADYASSLILKHNSAANSLNLDAVFSTLGKPLDPQWSQYSYEEILQMEDNGVLIPEEFLEWAHSMQSSNTVEYQLDTGDVNDINDAEGLQADIGDAGNMGKKNVAMVFNKQVASQAEIIQQAEQEFQQYSSQLESATDEAQTIQNNALKKVQELMTEWQTIDAKVKRGEELTEDEKSRYGQLGILMNNEVQSSSVQIENFTSDFDEISKKMRSASKEAKVAQDYANDTSFVGGLITEYESAHKSRVVTGNNHIFDGTTGVVSLLKANTVGKNLAVTSIKESGDLQDVTFGSDKAIKKVSLQIKGLTAGVDISNEQISDTVVEGQNKGSAKAPQNQEQNQNQIEPPPTEDNPEVIAQINQSNENDRQNENIFADNEDLNNINTILKRQQRQAPKIQPQDVIIN